MSRNQRHTVESVLALVDDTPREPDTGCRIWPHVKDGDGYPTISLDARTTRVTRIVLAHALGRALLSTEQACHTCDTPSCVEVAHLWAGTNADNHADCARKGRHRSARGEMSPNAKLTAEQVLEIRRRLTAGDHNRALAREFNVAPSHITAIKQRTAWRHLEGATR